jgi:D-sedoheptulose 7-phosphate isomerase
MEELLERYPALKECEEMIKKAENILLKAFQNGGKLLVCGNGGSCADSGHIVGELMKGFLLKREIPNAMRKKLEYVSPELGGYLAENLQGALPAISLNAQSALISAFANDIDADMIYAQQVYGYAEPGDVFLGITTSGNSKNVVNAALVAKACGMQVIGLVGKNPCCLDKSADAVIHVPETETYKVQELHLPVYHCLCARCEKEIFGDN